MKANTTENRNSSTQSNYHEYFECFDGKMRSFLLLIILLTTGCEANDRIPGCEGGWVEVTCKNLRSSKKPQADNGHRCNVKNGEARVVIQEGDPKTTTCNCGEKQFTVFVNDKNGCQQPFTQVAYLNAKTTIKCEYPGEEDNNTVKFFCKDKTTAVVETRQWQKQRDTTSTCDNILSTKSHSNQNGTFSLIKTSSGMNISISKVSRSHDGVYWCGVESSDGSYKAARRQITLTTIYITTFSRSLTVGQKLTYWCELKQGARTVFICKGEDPTACDTITTTAKPDMNPRFSIKEDPEKTKNLTITVREVTTSDTGTYWCRGETSDKGKNNQFFHRFLMTVGVGKQQIKSEPTSPPTTSVFSTHSTISAFGDNKKISITVSTSLVLLLLLLCVIASIVILKRRSQPKTPPNGGTARSIREDYVYEEIEERSQTTDPGSKVNTVYATANFSTDPSASLHYSTINFQKHSDKPGSKALDQRSVCEYSAVKYSKSPTCSTDMEPGRSSQDPLYATLNKVQEC